MVWFLCITYVFFFLDFVAFLHRHVTNGDKIFISSIAYTLIVVSMANFGKALYFSFHSFEFSCHRLKKIKNY